MTDKINYPIDDMTHLARELRTFLREQLSQHNQIFYNQPHSYNDLTQGLAYNIPNAGGLAQSVIGTITDTHHTITTCYSDLLDLVDKLEQSANGMQAVDNDIARGFNANA